MTASSLNRLLDDKITVDDFKASIADEVEQYARLINKAGSIIDLRFHEDEEIHLDRLRFRKLLAYVVANRLSNIHLAYICDCLTLTEELTTDEKTKELIFEIANPEINGGYVDRKKLAEMITKIE